MGYEIERLTDEKMNKLINEWSMERVKTELCTIKKDTQQKRRKETKTKQKNIEEKKGGRKEHSGSKLNKRLHT